MFNEVLRWSRVGDWIWKHLLDGETPSAIKGKLSAYVDELADRQYAEELQAEKSDA